MSYVKTAPKRYFLEVVTASISMVGIARLVRYLAHSAANPALILAAKLLVLLPVVIIGLAVLRLYRSRDELQQQLMLRTTAIAGLVSLLAMMAYVPLISLGLPQFSLQIAILILSGSYAVIGVVVAFIHLRSVSGSRQAFIRMAPMIAMPLLPAAYWITGFFLPLPPLSFRLGLLLFSAGALIAGFWSIFLRPTDQ